MCLYKVISVKDEKTPKGEYKTGWKAVTINIKKKGFTSVFSKVTKLCDKWLKCKSKEILTDGYGEEYPTGFHIFNTRQGARQWKSSWERVVKVRYRRIIARGIQLHQGYNCIIAKEMYVESPSKKTNK